MTKKAPQKMSRFEKIVTVISFIVLLVTLLNGGSDAWNNALSFLHSSKMQIQPFADNDILYFYIVNNGDKMALVSNYTLCWVPEGDPSVCINGAGSGVARQYGKPLEIKEDVEGIEVFTNYSIGDLAVNFVHLNNQEIWGVNICMINSKCKFYFFNGLPKPRSSIVDNTYLHQENTISQL